MFPIAGILFLLIGSVHIASAIELHQSQITWLQSKGGYLNDKIEIKDIESTTINDDDTSASVSGLFATKDILEGEKLIVIPRKCLLVSDDGMCGTTQKLMREFSLGSDSEFAPYVQYVFQQKRGILPSAWSSAAKDLLHKIYGEELLDTPGLTDLNYERDCDGSGDIFEETAYLAVWSRSWDDKMVPILDLINHRRGRYSNVNSTSAHGQDDIHVIASQNILGGEQLQYSYSECIDCEGLSLTYVAQHMVTHFGFVEQFPRRWRFDTSPEATIFDLDVLSVIKSNQLSKTATAEEVGGDDTLTTLNPHQMQVSWLSSKPDLQTINFMRAHLKRVQNLHEEVFEQTRQFHSKHERDLTIEFYGALKMALQHAIWAAMDTFRQVTVEAECNAQTCLSSFGQYDDLQDKPDPLFYGSESRCSVEQYTFVNDHDEMFEWTDGVESQYQTIDFSYNEQTDDVCLELNSWLQACSSFRPTYHEVFVHYPARFLNTVRRVIFLGGGDSMILHEILKYPSLELVIGLELDQQVVRQSFISFGTLPHFDNDKVQWIFGDATKSLLSLPEEYYGSFDLVLIDLQTDVVNNLLAMKNLSIMEMATLLVSREGIIAKNEDFLPRKTPDFTDYIVDLAYDGVPVICEQSIILGSNNVDFLKRKLTDHNIETLYLEPVTKNHMKNWYNYGKNITRKDRFCTDEIIYENYQANIDSVGALMILEVEHVKMPLRNKEMIRERVSEALDWTGLTIISFQASFTDDRDRIGDEFLFVLKEGYIIIRTWLDYEYCSIDINLWNNYYKQEAARNNLISAFGSSYSSSFRIVTGGMHGRDTREYEMRAGPNISAFCKQQTVATVQKTTSHDNHASLILSTSMSLIQNTDAVVVVLCGQSSQPCNSLEIVTKETNVKNVVPVWACSSTVEGGVQNSPKLLHSCEKSIEQMLEESVQTVGRFSGIVIDMEAPRVMGQILHKILSSTIVRKKLIVDDRYVVLSLLQDHSKDLWQRVLMERFRTDFAVFDPSYRAQVFFNTTTSSLELDIFSSGDSEFYLHLADLTSRITSETGLFAEVRQVMNGVLNYVVAEEQPSKVFSQNDYDSSSHRQQWDSQQALAMQTIFQFSDFNVKPETVFEPLSTEIIKEIFQETLLSIDFGSNLYFKKKVFEDVGSGCVIAAFWSDASAILVWDGWNHIDINLFIRILDPREGKALANSFVDSFIDKAPFTATINRDEHPRGIGRVVNFEQGYYD